MRQKVLNTDFITSIVLVAVTDYVLNAFDQLINYNSNNPTSGKIFYTSWLHIDGWPTINIALSHASSKSLSLGFKINLQIAFNKAAIMVSFLHLSLRQDNLLDYLILKLA